MKNVLLNVFPKDVKITVSLDSVELVALEYNLLIHVLGLGV